MNSLRSALTGPAAGLESERRATERCEGIRRTTAWLSFLQNLTDTTPKPTERQDHGAYGGLRSAPAYMPQHKHGKTDLPSIGSAEAARPVRQAIRQAAQGHVLMPPRAKPFKHFGKPDSRGSPAATLEAFYCLKRVRAKGCVMRHYRLQEALAGYGSRLSRKSRRGTNAVCTMRSANSRGISHRLRWGSSYSCRSAIASRFDVGTLKLQPY